MLVSLIMSENNVVEENMRVPIAYSRAGLNIEVPDGTDVIKSVFVPGLQNEAEAIRGALHEPIDTPPLKDLVRAGDKVAVVHTDITRATPNNRILPVILAELEHAGVQCEDITLINGLGTHRRQTEAELREMLGAGIVEKYRCLQHDCRDDGRLVSMENLKFGHPFRVNRDYFEADFKILTGFIEPHFFAGFSGGPKAVLPALAGFESVFTNHGYDMIAHPKATWGVTDGNPIWEEMKEAALLTEPDFLVNVAMNNKREISAVFAGDMLAAHSKGCTFVNSNSMIAVDEPYDIVITSNSGYPLDQNLYQSVKGMSAAAKIVRQGGAIIVAAGCEDGLPNHGSYALLLKEAGTPQGVLDMISQPGFEEQDQWQVQIQAQVQLKADIFVYSDGLTDRQITSALLRPCRDISALLAELMDVKGKRICVLPEGPQVIPYIESRKS
ncbi:MAG: nickel-dependent lactate racemase [Anaerolineaceae bacterium]|nr:nickel-dependent lactate racemase [Anaerolineaceae bacterium]